MKKFNQWFNRKWGWFFTNGNKQTPDYSVTFNKIQVTPFPNGIPSHEDIETVEMALGNSEQMGISKEVVAYALLFMKETPTLSIGEAITMGYLECMDKKIS